MGGVEGTNMMKPLGRFTHPWRLINIHMNQVIKSRSVYRYFNVPQRKRVEMLKTILKKETNQMSKKFLTKVSLFGGILFLLVTFLCGPAMAAKDGAKVGSNLYHVHTKVLWDLGWLTDANYLEGGHFTYNATPKYLVYGPNRTLFLNPLEGYGVPAKGNGAYRKVRLYVNYGHQEGCNGTPTVRITNGVDQVEFSLSIIGGEFGDIGAGWTEYRDLSEFQGIGHARIQVYQKDHTGVCSIMGAVYRIEAYFYDGYGNKWK
jgi:hypothetical protein